jgi:hypothetical protein
MKGHRRFSIQLFLARLWRSATGFLAMAGPALVIAGLSVLAVFLAVLAKAPPMVVLAFAIFAASYVLLRFTATLVLRRTMGRIGMAALTLPRAIVGMTVLALPLTVFAFLHSGPAILCSGGRGLGAWPWLFIGWTTFAIFGLPARVVAFLEDGKIEMTGLFSRALLALAWFPAIWLLGSPFQSAQGCTLSGLGFIGVSAQSFALFGAFAFVACLSIAAISAAAVETPERR